MKGKIYLIPTYLGEENNDSKIFPLENIAVINKINYYIVENARTARRNLKQMGLTKKIEDLTIFELDKHDKNLDYKKLLEPVFTGNDIGVLSEAGCPGIADPGSEVVKQAHKLDISVVPLIGASSIFLSLMASGFNGQNFKFHGYLPIKNPERTKKIKDLEISAHKHNETQIFIETPYRNNQLLNDLVTNCSPHTQLCIACDITLETEFIKTKSIEFWKKNPIDLNKRPVVFLIN